MFLLRNGVKHYDWGSPSAIPQFLGDAGDDRPVAEMWIGTHPLSPSSVVDAAGVAKPLADVAGDLPFMVKLLAADRPLSLQVHPSRSLAEIGFGVLMVFSAMGPGGRPLMALLSAIALAFGIIVVADGWSSDFERWFAVSDSNGWIYVIAGAVGLLSAVMMPTVNGRERRSVRERRHFGRPHLTH